MNSFIIQILTVLHICVTQISTVDATTCDIFFWYFNDFFGHDEHLNLNSEPLILRLRKDIICKFKKVLRDYS